MLSTFSVAPMRPRTASRLRITDKTVAGGRTVMVNSMSLTLPVDTVIVISEKSAVYWKVTAFATLIS